MDSYVVFAWSWSPQHHLHHTSFTKLLHFCSHAQRQFQHSSWFFLSSSVRIQDADGQWETNAEHHQGFDLFLQCHQDHLRATVQWLLYHGRLQLGWGISWWALTLNSPLTIVDQHLCRCWQSSTFHTSRLTDIVHNSHGHMLKAMEATHNRL